MSLRVDARQSRNSAYGVEICTDAAVRRPAAKLAEVRPRRLLLMRARLREAPAWQTFGPAFTTVANGGVRELAGTFRFTPTELVLPRRRSACQAFENLQERSKVFE